MADGGGGGGVRRRPGRAGGWAGPAHGPGSGRRPGPRVRRRPPGRRRGARPPPVAASTGYPVAGSAPHPSPSRITLDEPDTGSGPWLPGAAPRDSDTTTSPRGDGSPDQPATVDLSNHLTEEPAAGSRPQHRAGPPTTRPRPTGPRPRPSSPTGPRPRPSSPTGPGPRPATPRRIGATGRRVTGPTRVTTAVAEAPTARSPAPTPRPSSSSTTQPAGALDPTRLAVIASLRLLWPAGHTDQPSARRSQYSAPGELGFYRDGNEHDRDHGRVRRTGRPRRRRLARKATLPAPRHRPRAARGVPADVIAEVEQLDPEHPDAVAVRRATAGLFKTVKLRRRRDRREAILANDRAVTAATATGAPEPDRRRDRRHPAARPRPRRRARACCASRAGATSASSGTCRSTRSITSSARRARRRTTATATPAPT